MNREEKIVEVAMHAMGEEIKNEPISEDEKIILYKAVVRQLAAFSIETKEDLAGLLIVSARELEGATLEKTLKAIRGEL